MHCISLQIAKFRAREIFPEPAFRGIREKLSPRSKVVYSIGSIRVGLARGALWARRHLCVRVLRVAALVPAAIRSSC